MGISNRYTTKGTKKLLKKLRGPFMTRRDVFTDGVPTEPLTTKILSHTTHLPITVVYLQTWKRGII